MDLITSLCSVSDLLSFVDFGLKSGTSFGGQYAVRFVFMIVFLFFFLFFNLDIYICTQLDPPFKGFSGIRNCMVVFRSVDRFMFRSSHSCHF